MGVETIKDNQGNEHMVFSNEDFYNDDIMGTKFEDYEILKQIQKRVKKNDFVYQIVKVLSKFNSKIYAIKILEISNLLEIDLLLISKELDKLKDIQHTNIAKFYKYFIQDEQLYLIYEYFDYCNLDDYMKIHKTSNKPIKEDMIWNILMQCISAIYFLHTKDIVHKKIELPNIFITNEQVVKLGHINPQFLSKNKLYNKAEDMRSLGSAIFQLCHFCFPGEEGIKNKGYYSNELEQVLNVMLNYIKDEPKILYDKIQIEYLSRYAKLTSIQFLDAYIMLFLLLKNN